MGSRYFPWVEPVPDYEWGLTQVSSLSVSLHYSLEAAGMLDPILRSANRIHLAHSVRTEAIWTCLPSANDTRCCLNRPRPRHPAKRPFPLPLFAWSLWYSGLWGNSWINHRRCTVLFDSHTLWIFPSAAGATNPIQRGKPECLPASFTILVLFYISFRPSTLCNQWDEIS
jgi:hypothetical protein